MPHGIIFIFLTNYIFDNKMITPIIIGHILDS